MKTVLASRCTLVSLVLLVCLGMALWPRPPVASANLARTFFRESAAITLNQKAAILGASGLLTDMPLHQNYLPLICR